MLRRRGCITDHGNILVSRRDVIKYWLQLELEKDNTSIEAIEQLDTPKLVSELLEYTGGEDTILWKESDVKWFEKQITTGELGDLKTIRSPVGVGWHKIAPSFNVVDCAERILADEVCDSTTQLVDIQYIKEIESQLPDYHMKNIIIQADQTLSPPRVIDGNHHAVAAAMHYIKTGECPRLKAYVGRKQISTLQIALQKVAHKVTHQSRAFL